MSRATRAGRAASRNSDNVVIFGICSCTVVNAEMSSLPPLPERIDDKKRNNKRKPGEESGRRLRSMQCAICYDEMVYPTELPCGHTFCFLCVKGIFNQSRSCAMCRQQFVLSHLRSPKVQLDDISQDSYNWYYEGSSGWWRYDPRSNKEIEDSYQKEKLTCDVLIAGRMFVIDLKELTQKAKYDFPFMGNSRVRSIKREHGVIACMGVGGLKWSDGNSRIQYPLVSYPFVFNCCTQQFTERNGIRTPRTSRALLMTIQVPGTRQMPRRGNLTPGRPIIDSSPNSYRSRLRPRIRPAETQRATRSLPAKRRTRAARR